MKQDKIHLLACLYMMKLVLLSSCTFCYTSTCKDSKNKESIVSAIVIYTKPYCPYCTRAKALLTSKQVSFAEIDLGLQPQKYEEMTHRAGGKTTVPQIFIGEKHIGGCSELFALENAHELDSLLRIEPQR